MEAEREPAKAKRTLRHLLHLVVGSVPPLLGLVLDRPALLWFLGVVTAIFVLGDGLRLLSPAVNQRLMRLVRPAGGEFKSDEGAKPIGATFFVLGAFLTFLLFPRDTAIAALLFASVGDAAAATVGERWGQVRLGSKSLEGSSAFLASSLVAGAALLLIGLELTPLALVVGAVLATLIELAPVPINDNLTIPLVSAAAMRLVIG